MGLCSAFSQRLQYLQLVPCHTLPLFQSLDPTLLKILDARLSLLLDFNWFLKCFLDGSCFRSSHPEVLLGKGVLKICSKVTGEHPCRSAISITLQSNFIEITLRHGWSPPNLLHILRTPFLNNSSGRLLLLFFDGTSRNSMSCFWCILWRFHVIRVCNETFSFYNFQTFLWMS